MDIEISNKIANSELISFDLESIFPEGERVIFDIKPLLFEELILREKYFREYIKNHDWSSYKEKFVAITCSTDAIVPTWAYMLLSIKLQPFANLVIFGNLESLEDHIWRKTLSTLDLNQYNDKKVVIKGCSKKNVPIFAYTEIVQLLRPMAFSIMFGEPCSTVPLYKKVKNN